MRLSEVKKQIVQRKNHRKAKTLQRFFKTGPGQYAEGDVFYGVNVPTVRKLAIQYKNLSIKDTLILLKSPVHEERLLALLIFILKYKNGNEKAKEKIYKSYLKHTKYINNWDLVDVSAKHIVGDFLFEKDKSLLYKLAKSDSLWERRISILSTFNFIEKKYFDDTLNIAKILLKDSHDLIHKAAGWMLREIGKRNIEIEERFLKKHYRSMPRTMLRYAIERFPRSKRLSYLK